MDIFGIGTNELLVILILAAVVLGPERLARSARDRQADEELQDDLKKTTDEIRKLQARSLTQPGEWQNNPD